ncbi:MAG: chemotaxis protein CheB [Pseudomonadota bacterium]
MTQPQDHAAKPSHYVVIGASAGGLEAIDTFFKHMPSDSGCAFIVVQHLSPDYKSLMAELLSKRTEMPVNRAEEGEEVEADHVYLIPPNHDLRIFHGKLLLTEQKRNGGINLPIDIFLASLAEDQGDKSVAIILSGTGSDGTRGIRAIKERVGMVMVQDEETATFDGMPRSAIATGLVDYVLPPEEMPQQLISYVHHPYAKKSESPDTLLSDEDSTTRIYALLREKTGVDFTYYKPSTMVRRIERRMSVNQLLSLRDYVRYMESYTPEIDALHRDLLIGVTSFFRDPQAYRHLEEKWLPDLLREHDNKPIRIWVAGCSTGEEAYSIAILCHEVMSDIGKLAEVKIFATDVDKDAIATAGTGVYPESISADVPPHLLGKYFHRRENDYLIARHIREMVVFAQHNVIKDPPFTNIAMVTCRNLMIYLQPVLQQRVLELFNFSLNPDGLLFLGTSETTGDLADAFEPLHHKWKLYRSRGRKRRDALSEQAISFDASGKLIRPATNPVVRGYRSHMHEEERISERLLKGISGHYLPLTMVINDNMELLHVVGDATDYLQFPTGKMQVDISKLARKELAIPIATGVQKVLKSRKEIDYSNIHLSSDASHGRAVDMHIRLLPTTKAQDPLIGIFIEERVRPISGNGEADSPSYDIGKEAEQRINDLEQELQFTRENLQATVEELETSNEELQATNEELLASNEELQSTNEELQSVNEELYTVNAEHQSKIAELIEVNNDMDNLLCNIRIGTLFLDHNLEIRRYTHEVTRFIRIIDKDMGRPFSHLSHDLVDIDLHDLVERTNRSHESFEQEVQDRSGNNYLVRIFPYRAGPDTYTGVLLTFVNINASRKLQEELLLSEERNRLAQQAANIGNWDWDITRNELIWSETIETMFGLQPGAFDGRYDTFLSIVHKDDRQMLEREVNQCIDNPERPFQVKHRITWGDGTVRWVQENGMVQTGNRGQATRMIGIVQDITEARHAEEALERSEHLFRSTLENLDMLALQVGQDGTILFVNDFLLAQTGWHRSQLLGERLIERLVPEAQRDEIERIHSHSIEASAETPRHFECNILTAKGAHLSVHWNNTVIYDDHGQPIGMSLIGQPVNDEN